MRAIFVVLLIANLAYGGWTFWQMRGVPVKEAPQASSKLAGSMADYPVTLKVVSAAVRSHADTGKAAATDCKLLGSWSTQQAAIKARLALPPELGEPVTLRRVAHKPDLDWVFLAPFDSRKDAERVLSLLHAQQVDSFIVVKGDDANAISLGYFSNHQLAQALQERLEGKGYAVEVRITEHDFSAWWLQFDAAMWPKLQAYMASVGTQQQLKLQACDSAD